MEIFKLIIIEFKKLKIPKTYNITLSIDPIYRKFTRKS